MLYHVLRKHVLLRVYLQQPEPNKSWGVMQKPGFEASCSENRVLPSKTWVSKKTLILRLHE